MKNILTLIVACCLSGFSLCQYNWKWIAPNPPVTNTYSSAMMGNNVYFWGEDNIVIKMDIPTESFEVLPPYAQIDNSGLGCCNTQGIAFADSLNGYITDAAHGEFRTTDAGHSWIKTADEGSNIELVLFSTNSIGWKAGGGGFYRTANNGVSWYYISTPLFESGIFSKMFALNNNQLWMLKSFYYNKDGGVWYSSNSGTNWVQVNTGLISDTLDQISYSDMKINSTGIGFLSGSIYYAAQKINKGFIQKTTDFGITWVTQYFDDEVYHDILLINDSECVLFGFSNNVSQPEIIERKTTDSGLNWSLISPFQSLPYQYNLNNAVYIPAKDIIIAFVVGGIYKSTDRGNTFSRITSETDTYISNIVFEKKPKSKDEQIIIAWNYGLNYLMSLDAGTTWKQKTLPAAIGNSLWLAAIAEGVIYIIMDQLSLYKSTDLGVTWNQLDIQTYTGLQALSIYDKNTFTLNAYFNIVSSTDGGNTFIKGPLDTHFGLKETTILKPGSIIGVGYYDTDTSQKGMFFRTTDFGFSWRVIDADYEMNQIVMTNDNIGYALSQKRVYKTTDAGNNWNILLSSSDFLLSYNSLSFLDSLRGMVWTNNDFQITNDGGKIWTSSGLNLPIRYTRDIIATNDRGDLFAVGDGRLLMYPSYYASAIGFKSFKNNSDIPQNYTLFQNFPNPFNPNTVISYSLPSASNVKLIVYNTLGQTVKVLESGYKQPGNYSINFNASDLPSGIYFYKLEAGQFSQIKKMMLIK